MARGVNKCIFIGNLGKDAEMRFMPNGNGVCSFSIAVSEVWKDKQTGDPQERTEWINIVVFGRLGESIVQYLKKGTSVYVEGKYKTEKWKDKQTQQDRYAVKIVADTVQLLGSKGGGGGERREESRPQQQTRRESPPEEEFDDDIPF